jgi:hypothetical protein
VKQKRLNVEQIVTVLRKAEVGVPLEKQLRIAYITIQWVRRDEPE